MNDPTVPGGGQGFLTRLHLSGAIDDETLEGIASNVSLKGEFGQTIQAVTQGEFPIMLGMDAPYVALNQARGVPIEIVFMDEDNIAMPQQMFAIDGAPNPNATRLWMNWVFSEEAQQQMAEQGNTPITGVESPYGFPTFEDANLADMPSREELEEQTPALQEQYTEIFLGR